jgi:hypothetical protein
MGDARSSRGLLMADRLKRRSSSGGKFSGCESSSAERREERKDNVERGELGRRSRSRNFDAVDLVSREGREGLSRGSDFFGDFVGEDDAGEGASEALVVEVDFFLPVKRDGIGVKPEAEQPIYESPLWWSYFFSSPIWLRARRDGW